MNDRVLQGRFDYNAYEFIETQKAPGYVYADEYYEPALISWFVQSPFSVDITGNGVGDVVLPMNRGYATGLDTRTPFIALEGTADGLRFSQSLQDSMPVTNGARRAEPIYLAALQKDAYVTVAHDTGDGKGAELLVLTSGLTPAQSTARVIPTLPDAPDASRYNFVNAHALASGDLNGDGLMDLLVGQWQGDGPYALLQSEQGRFVVERQPLFSDLSGSWPLETQDNPDAFNSLLDLHMADFTGDGLDDVLVGWGHGSTRSYLFVNQDGRFAADQKLALPVSIYGIDNQLHLKTLSADFDRDGDLDLAILWSRDEPYYGGHYIQYLENDGAGNFTDKTTDAFSEPFQDADGDFLSWSNAWQALDINDDGRMDLVGVSSDDAGQGRVYLNLGHGKFLDYTIVSANAQNPTIVYWGDFDADGKLDYVTFDSFWNDAAGTRSTNRFNVHEIDFDWHVGDRVAFGDVTLAFDTDGIAGQAYRLYKAAFDRQPDSEGLGFWVKTLDAGVSLTWVAQRFIDSPEFEGMYGANASDERFIELLYANVLDREPDQSGYDYWLDVMSQGLSQADVLTYFSESPENVKNVAPLIEDGIQYTAFVG